MFWLHCGLFVLVIAVSGFISSLADTTSKRGNACLLPARLPVTGDIYVFLPVFVYIYIFV